jgi:glycosyltransferase involved in cell wall biosynthesis
MFFLDYTPIDYSDPWLMPYLDRIRNLQKKDKKVAYFYENPDNSTFRYRVYNMIQVIEKLSLDVSSAYFCNADKEHWHEVVAIADTIVICRTKYSDNINRLISLAKAKGKKVLFDVDDFIFNVSYAHLILNTLDQDLTHPNVWDFWFAYIGRLGETLKLCDGAITTNAFLAEQINSFASIPTYIIPNFINNEQMQVSEQLFKQKVASNFKRDKKIHVGYFSGTPTHNKDFDIIVNPLIEIFEKHPNVILRIVGHLELKGRIKDYSSQIEFFPFQNFIDLQHLIAETEINLMPLQDNIFTNCKSELKFFEASIVGTLSLASPTYTYASAIKDSNTGYLCNSFEWFYKLDKIINSISNYPDIAKASYYDIEKKYAWYNQLQLIEETLF